MSFASSSGNPHDWLSNRSGRTSTGASTSAIGSPRPGSSVVSRPSPQWPWGSNRSAHSTQSYISPAPTPSPSRFLPAAEEAQWTTQQGMRLPAEALTRQWTFSAFEWTVKHAGFLRDHVESTPSNGQPSSDSGSSSDNGVDEDGVPLVLRQSPLIGENGENKYKVEIALTPPSDERSSTPTSPEDPNDLIRLQTLSLYITSLFLDCTPDMEICTAIMVAIKSREDRAGERGTRSDWVWEFWDPEFVFRNGSESWGCQLPLLSNLMQHPRIAGFYPQFPQVYYVPRDLLEGLEASLDNPQTGDVRFVTLEWHPRSFVDDGQADRGQSLSPASSISATHPGRPLGMARKRTIYAHSDILKRRSEYFSTMLSSTFAESMPATPPSRSDALHPPRRVHEIIVSEADFETIYWLLKWCYADWILFKDEDDPRNVVNVVGAGWSVHSLTTPMSVPGQGEWDWRKLSHHRRRSQSTSGAGSDSADAPEDDTNRERSIRSSSSVGTAPTEAGSVISDITRSRTIGHAGTSASRGGGSASARGGRTTSISTSTSRASSATITPATRRVNIPGAAHKTSTGSGSSRTSGGLSVRPSGYDTHGTAASASPQRPRYPPAIHTPMNSSGPVPDPHPHPTPELPPASALAIYRVAHRYSLPGLQTLALEHIMNTITPKSSFPILLASHFWDDLHGLIEDYIVEHFDAVARCDVFDRCCEEVAAGEWGTEGGKTLAALFRRLAILPVTRYARS